MQPSDEKPFSCRYCESKFRLFHHRDRHERSVHKKFRFKCTLCPQEYTRKENLKNHVKRKHGDDTSTSEENHNSSKDVSPQPSTFQQSEIKENVHNIGKPIEMDPSTSQQSKMEESEDNMRENIEVELDEIDILNDIFLQNPPSPETIQRQVDDILTIAGVENETSDDYNSQVGFGKDNNTDLTREPYENEDGSIDEKLKEIYSRYGRIIYSPHRRAALSHEYNFHLPTGEVTIEQLRRQLTEIYESETNVFKIQLSLGLVISNRETGDLRFFYPHNNESVLETPMVISEREDLELLLEKLSTVDFEEQIRRSRPDTKWLPYRVIMTRWMVYPFDFPLGGSIELPPYIKNNKSIVCLNKDTHDKLYKNDLCAFRCLSYHRSKNLKKANSTLQPLVETWQQVTGKEVIDGLTLPTELPLFEDTFEVNVNIFSLHENGEVESVYRSISKYISTMNMNLYRNHLSYINNMSLYAKKYKCSNCDKIFSTNKKVNRHAKSCNTATKYTYPGGYYTLKPTLFEALEENGIVTPPELRYYPFFICYDFEALLVQQANNTEAGKLQWLTEHVPISVAVSSNVSGYETAKCFIHEDLNCLLQMMFEYLDKIQVKATALMKKQFAHVINQLDEALETCDDDNLEEQLLGLQIRLKEYMAQIPLLGYNSSKYDLVLVKKAFVKHLTKSGELEPSFVVKKGNAYSCIATKQYKLLDIMNYVTPGTSYDAFLRSYKAEVRKSFFPYEWFNHHEKLQYGHLPPYEAFFSSLKNVNVLESEYNTFQKHLQSGYTENEALAKMNLKSIPLNGQEQYKILQSIWKQESMSSFADFLSYYNILDVQPFVQAVNNMLRFYRDKQIDLFKESISAPGVARKLLMMHKKKDCHFSLFSDDYKDIHSLFARNIVGGPSIIFHRYHKAGETFIRGGSNKCQSILGYDANSLYLWCIAQDMPTGPFTVRRAGDGFKKQTQEKYMKEIYYLEYVSHKLGIPVQHKLNGGQKRIGPYLVDGVCGNKVFEFMGCYYHKHDNCSVLHYLNSKKWQQAAKRKREADAKRRQYIESKGYEVTEMWECQFDQMVKEDQELGQFVEKYKRPCDKYSTMTEEQIKKAVLDDKLFGAIEVDIEVKAEDYSHFSEMGPIFCTTEVPMDAIGEHMKQYMKQHSMSEKPRKLLVGAMKAKKILLATPLLKWYMQHNLNVTKIHTVVEFSPVSCFEEFVSMVSDARRLGDTDKALEPFGNTMKLLGNSAYGGMILDKLKHMLVKFLFDEHEARLKINDPRFRKLDEIDDHFLQMEMAKKKIILDLPNQIGFFILQYAKLKMLSFHFDLLDVFVDRNDYQMVEMDTDSAYFACSKPTLEEAIRPDMQEEFSRVKHQWFPRDDTKEHKMFDKRTPGLFKLEFRGSEIAALCSKTYSVYDEDTDTAKFSCKGVNKHNYTNPMDIYKSVLRTGKAYQGNITGFRQHNNTMFTYTQDRIGFSYFYCKRKVLSDGVSTAPLDIVLTPASEK